MKAHTQTFKENLTTLGKEINAKVIYTIDGVETELDGDTLGSVTPHYEGNILKSVMKQVDIMSDIDIPLNTEINVQFGMKYDDEEFEYIDYGNYIVYSSEKQEDTNNYKIIAYDKMLYAMKDYESLFEINLFDDTLQQGTTIYNTGVYTTGNNRVTSTNWITLPAGTYTIDAKTNLSGAVNVSNVTFDTNENFYEISGVSGQWKPVPFTFTTPIDLKWKANFRVGADVNVTPSNITDIVLIQKDEIEEVYPTTIKKYIEKLCTKIGLTFANSNEVFANYDKEIPNELYANLGYTYRDVLDDLAQVTASTICINDEDKLEIRYLNESVNDSEEVEGTNLTLSDSESAKINGVVVEGDTTQDGTPTPSSPIPINVVSGDNEINICGKNLLNINNWVKGRINKTTGLIEYANNTTSMIIGNNDISFVVSQAWNSGITSDFIPISTGSHVFKYGHNREITMAIDTYDSQKTKIARIDAFTQTQTPTTRTFTISDSNVKFIRIHFEVNTANVEYIVSDMQLEKGSTATTYEPYKNNILEVNLGKNLAISHWVDSRTDRYITSLRLEADLKPDTTYTISFNGTSGNTFYANENLFTTSPSFTLTSERKSITLTTKSDISKNYANQYNATGGWAILKNGAIQPNNNAFNNVQIEKGTQPTSYSPYFEPIFLGEIGNYKDLIFKSEGINLFDGIFRQGNRYTTGLTDTTRLFTTQNYLVKKDQVYIMSTTLNTSVYKWAVNLSAIEWPIAGGTTYFYDSGWKQTSTFTFTPNQDGYLGIVVAKSNGTDTITPNDISNFTWQLEEGNQATTFEPYGSKGKWLLHKEIGKVVLNGSESWINEGGSAPYTLGLTNLKRNNNSIMVMSNYYQGTYYNSSWGSFSYMITANQESANAPRLKIKNVDIASLDNFKIWLSAHNTTVYYVLSTPTTTEITNDNYPELLSQLKALDKAKTYEGITNITSSFPIRFSYATDYETINEDYIKNTRASFGEKYGPINSIVLSRSAESDNIYIQDEESIEENGLCEVKIKDNQIMNSDNRNEYLDDLLSYLGGIEYYTNDYESIGITYLDLCDKYKVQIGDTKYDCIMFNDEVEIHDGLNEIIYANKPKEEVTDYKKATTTDKLKRQTSLIVDKQNERIEAIVGDVESDFASIRIDMNGIKSEVQGYDTIINEQGEEIQELRKSYTEQTPEMISDWFDTNLKATLDDLQNTASGNDEEIRKIKAYVRRGVITDPQSPYYNQAYIELGDETNQTTLRILQNRIQFLTNGQETAFISNNQLYINESTILTKEKVGHWVTTEDEDGLLNTYWED